MMKPTLRRNGFFGLGMGINLVGLDTPSKSIRATRPSRALYLAVYNISCEVFQRVAFCRRFQGFEAGQRTVDVPFGLDHRFFGAAARAHLVDEARHVLVIGPAAVR